MTPMSGENDRGQTGVDLLWGDRNKPLRGPKPGLSLELIVRTAIGIADAEGLDALSMQRIAGALEFTTMSLYRYVPSKDVLVDLIMDTAAGTPPDMTGAVDWRESLERWTNALWSRYQEHPWMLHVRLSGPPLGPNQLGWLESALTALSGTGLNANEMVSVALFLNGAVTGLARLTSDTVGTPDSGADYVETLQRLVTPDQFPTLSSVVAAGAFSGDTSPGGFGLPLHRLLDGIEVYLRSKGPQLR